MHDLTDYPKIQGENSYVTVEEADQIVARYFRSDDPVRIKWLGKPSTDPEVPSIPPLPVEDKEILLLRSLEYIDSLRFRGRKADIGQMLQFPRFAQGIGFSVIFLPFIPQAYDPNVLSDDYGSPDGGLKVAKKAQAVNAAFGAMTDTSQVALNIYAREVTGVSSLRSGSLSETYTSLSPRARAILAGNFAPDIVDNILKDWLSSSKFAL